MPWVNLGRLGHALVSFPAPIVPLAPDFINCDARYGQFLKMKDCRLATVPMPRSREGAEVDWAVNHQGRDHQFNLPVTFKSGLFERSGKYYATPLDLRIHRGLCRHHRSTGSERTLRHWSYKSPFYRQGFAFSTPGVSCLCDQVMHRSNKYRGRRR